MKQKLQLSELKKGQFCNWTISISVAVIQKMRIKLSFRLTGEENTAKKIFFTDERKLLRESPREQPEWSCVGQGGRRKRSQQTSCWLNARSLRLIWWCLLVCATVVKDNSISLRRRQKWMRNIAWTRYCRIWLKIAGESCQASSSSKFQQDGAPSHTASLAQDWLSRNCPEFIRKEEWPQNSPDLNPLEYHV